MFFVAVMVTYFPNDDVFENAKVLLEYFDGLVVVDNTDEEITGGITDKLSILEDLPYVTILRNFKNLGIAEALNQGCNKAIEMGASWITTFDQDSKLCSSLPEIIKQNYCQQKLLKNQLIVGASYLDPDVVDSNVFRHRSLNDISFCPASELISSGMSFPASLYKDLGGFDSALFIDMVDHDFCIKALLNGVSLYQTTHPVMIHSVGQRTAHHLFGRVFYTTNHSALRKYYYSRNTIIIFKRYVLKAPFRSFRHLLRLVKIFFRMLLFETEKAEKIISVLNGVVDGIARRTGQR